jgi:hypothetical protein
MTQKKIGRNDITLKPMRAASTAAAAGSTGGAPASNQGGCTEFSVSFALLTTDNKRQISFGVTRGCIDASTPLYVLSFVLRDKVDGGFQDRVKLLVTVGPESNDKAQAIIDRGLRSSQQDFLEGPITSKAKTAPVGTTQDTPKGKAIAKDVPKVLDK